MKIKLKREELKIIFSMLLIAYCIIQLINILYPSSESQDKYAYQIEQNTNYKVYLHKNDFIEKEYLGKDLLYLQALVDYIDFDFSYSFYSFPKQDIEYHYDIMATLYIDSQTSNQNLLTKEYEIVKNRYFKQEQSDKISIQEKINIPYQEYNTEVMRFKESFNIPVKAYVKIDFIVNTDILLEEKVSKTTVSESKIELAQSTFEIIQDKIGDTDNTIQTIENIDNMKYYHISLLVILMLSVLIYFVLQIRKNNRAKQGMYQLELTGLLKRYHNIIVEVKEELRLTEFKIIEVKEFEELLDIEEEIRKPILFYETIEQTAVFTILEDDYIAYQYTLNNPF